MKKTRRRRSKEEGATSASNGVVVGTGGGLYIGNSTTIPVETTADVVKRRRRNPSYYPDDPSTAAAAAALKANPTPHEENNGDPQIHGAEKEASSAPVPVSVKEEVDKEEEEEEDTAGIEDELDNKGKFQCSIKPEEREEDEEPQQQQQQQAQPEAEAPSAAPNNKPKRVREKKLLDAHTTHENGSPDIQEEKITTGKVEVESITRNLRPRISRRIKDDVDDSTEALLLEYERNQKRKRSITKPRAGGGGCSPGKKIKHQEEDVIMTSVNDSAKEKSNGFDKGVLENGKENGPKRTDVDAKDATKENGKTDQTRSQRVWKKETDEEMENESTDEEGKENKLRRSGRKPKGSSAEDKEPKPRGRKKMDEHGNEIMSYMCHQCQRNDKGRVVRCTKCKTKRYCVPCMTRW